ncbi:PREDICTED: outer dense fiber protein 3-like protein 2 [Poecilia mexicana]|uniref:outer dense fiber protein 3-like protein 2 n=1 Tax=Poecilia mexicana TaxID=48701 RepID=UPI00072E8708|nr:PREDICTED: outer dense fiber protein 3-like protein 2 [Poecilia mexicana]
MEEVVRKRPIISARERGPGPARYALPPTVGYINHDFTKPSSPAYSFHGRMSTAMISIDSSPGPRYYVGGKLTRFGRTETPSYSMSGRGRRIGKRGGNKSGKAATQESIRQITFFFSSGNRKRKWFLPDA